MLSAYLLLTREFCNSIMEYIGLRNTFTCDKIMDEPTVWLRSAKLPVYGEGLADKGFEFLDRLFVHFNQVRCPRVLRSRNVKQYDMIEIDNKADYCTLWYTSEAVFSFLENLDILKDGVPRENIHLIPYALEWSYASINLK